MYMWIACKIDLHCISVKLWKTLTCDACTVCDICGRRQLHNKEILNFSPFHLSQSILWKFYLIVSWTAIFFCNFSFLQSFFLLNRIWLFLSKYFVNCYSSDWVRLQIRQWLLLVTLLWTISMKCICQKFKMYFSKWQNIFV